jgi:hypothetical protein
MRPTSLLSIFSILLFSSVANAGSYDETVSGDLSGNRAAPTVVHLDPGANPLSATSVSGDVEYFTLNVPIGFRLSAINVTSYANGNLSFVAIQRGTTFTEPPTGTNVANLLGYSHFGSGNGTIGTDILDDMGTGAGSQGFVPPLGAGDYTFWSQEAGGVPVSYTLSFQLTAVPAAPATTPFAVLVLAVGVGLLGAQRIRGARRNRLHRI